MLCRLFIAESINPNDATNYNEANVKQSHDLDASSA